jgi:hypothetical protein
MITAEEARALLDYDRETGVIRWIVHVGNQYVAGDIAGGVTKYGYRRVRVLGRKYMAHRLAWLITHGHFPDGPIDHINGCRDDNRLVNLRAATREINNQNLRKARRNSKLGVLGVSMDRKRYKAQIQVGGKVLFIGNFSTAEDARAAYLAAKRHLHPGCTI